MSNGTTQPAVDPVGVVELTHLANKLGSHATSLYLAAPESLLKIRQIFSTAEEAIALGVKGVDATHQCPAGTVKCTRGCCYVE